MLQQSVRLRSKVSNFVCEAAAPRELLPLADSLAIFLVEPPSQLRSLLVYHSPSTIFETETTFLWTGCHWLFSLVGSFTDAITDHCDIAIVGHLMNL